MSSGRRGRAPKTMLEARRRADRIKADRIGAVDIGRLSGLDLDEFYARLAGTGGRTGRGLHTTTRHHFHSLIRAALIFVDATTGMRRGEICGLRFCDIDPVAGSATVWWRCSDLPKKQAATLEGAQNVLKAFPNGVVMLSATKNKKRRRFAMDPITLAVLAEQQARAEARCEALGVDLAPDAFVWSQVADHSEPWRPDRVSGAFTSLRNRQKLPHISFNDLRHFSATQLVAAGVDPRLVAGRLGHDASVLLRVDSHVIPARDQAAGAAHGRVDERRRARSLSRIGTPPRIGG